MIKEKYDMTLVGAAACSGSVEVMKFLMAQKVRLSTDTMFHAAQVGDYDMIEYLRTAMGETDRWTARMLEGAATGGQLRLLKVVQSEGDYIDRHRAQIARLAAFGCSVPVMDWLRQQYDVSYETEHLVTAINNRPEALKACQYLVGLGCQITGKALNAAACEPTSPSILQYFYEIGACELTTDLCTAAASGDSLDILRWLHEEVHCPWNAFEVASASMEFQCAHGLQYLYEQGERLTHQQLTELLCRSVRYVDNESELVCAKWLRANGAPWPAVLENDADDWPEAAVMWCRLEGCTAPLWSEVQANAE